MIKCKKRAQRCALCVLLGRIRFEFFNSPGQCFYLLGEVFNVGCNDQNLQIMPLARLVSESIGVPFNFDWYGSTDTRSYQVDFTKIKDVLGYKTDFTPREGAKEVYDALREGRVKDDLKTRTVDWYKHLLETHRMIKEVEYQGGIL